MLQQLGLHNQGSWEHRAGHQAWQWMGTARSGTQQWLRTPDWVMATVYLVTRQIMGTNKISLEFKIGVAGLEWGILRRTHGHGALLTDLLASICAALAPTDGSVLIRDKGVGGGGKLAPANSLIFWEVTQYYSKSVWTDLSLFCPLHCVNCHFYFVFPCWLMSFPPQAYPVVSQLTFKVPGSKSRCF